MRGERVTDEAIKVPATVGNKTPGAINEQMNIFLLMIVACCRPMTEEQNEAKVVSMKEE
jgi:hypothetical protein